MKKLIETIAQSAQAYPELDAFREALFGVLEIEDEPKRVALGFGSAFIEISSQGIRFVAGADSLSVYDLARIKSLADDLRQRLSLPFTEGTDEDVEDGWVDGNPTMPNKIIGGSTGSGGSGGADIDDTGTSPTGVWSSYKVNLELDKYCLNDDARLSNARAPTAHTHTIANVTGLQSAIDAKLNASVVSNTPPPGGELFWFEPAQALVPQPWVFKSNSWYSSIIVADFILPGLGLTGVTMVKLIPPRVPRVFLENIHAQLRSNGGSSSSTDFYAMTIRWFNRSGVQGSLLTFNNQNQAIGSSRFSSTQPNTVLEDAAYIELGITRTGTNSAMTLTTGASVDLRYGR